LIDADLQKMLNDMQKPDKIAKWITFPSACLTLEADVTSVLCQIPMRISPSFYPLRPWRVPSPESAPLSPSFELQSFADRNVEPLRGCTNLLYVNFSNSFSFTFVLLRIFYMLRFIRLHLIIQHKKHSQKQGTLRAQFVSSNQNHATLSRIIFERIQSTNELISMAHWFNHSPRPSNTTSRIHASTRKLKSNCHHHWIKLIICSSHSATFLWLMLYPANRVGQMK
jgi:hypothetical protein